MTYTLRTPNERARSSKTTLPVLRMSQRAPRSRMLLHARHGRGSVVQDQHHMAALRRVVDHLDQTRDAAVHEGAVADDAHHSLRLLGRQRVAQPQARRRWPRPCTPASPWPQRAAGRPANSSRCRRRRCSPGSSAPCRRCDADSRGRRPAACRATRFGSGESSPVQNAAHARARSIRRSDRSPAWPRPRCPPCARPPPDTDRPLR